MTVSLEDWIKGIKMDIEDFKKNPSDALTKAIAYGPLEVVDDYGHVAVVIDVPTPPVTLKIYTGYGAIVRIHKNHMEYGFLRRKYIGNFVYQGWEYDDDDIKIFTLPELSRETDHMFVLASQVTKPDTEEPIHRLEKILNEAIKDEFVEVIQPPQPLAWTYYE